VTPPLGSCSTQLWVTVMLWRHAEGSSSEPLAHRLDARQAAVILVER
jgi:hypothetical protein